MTWWREHDVIFHDDGPFRLYVAEDTPEAQRCEVCAWWGRILGSPDGKPVRVGDPEIGGWGVCKWHSAPTGPCENLLSHERFYTRANDVCKKWRE